MVQKKVHYYKMDLFLTKIREDSEGRQYSHDEPIPEKNIRPIFESLKKELKENTVRLPYSDKAVFLEYIDIDSNFLFGKLGNEKDENTIQLRNEVTLKPDPVPKQQYQTIEIFTYFLISLDTGIISYINGQSAPKIGRLEEVNKLCKDAVLSKYKCVIAPIPRKDIIEVIKKKKNIGKLRYTFTIPSDSILSDPKIGLTMEEFDEIDREHLKHQKITVELKAEPYRSFIKNSKNIGKLVNKIIERFGNRLTELKVDAKGEDEKMKNYNILEEHFTYQVDFELNEPNASEIRSKLIHAYMEYEDELKSLIRLS